MDYEIMMNGIVKIGDRAPEIEATTTMGKFNLNDYKGKWVVLFSHPGAYTPVCTTEMIAFARANDYFTERNTCLVGLSVDSNMSHLAWMYDIYCRTGIKLPFPIIEDRNGVIARKYGMVSNNVSTYQTVRNIFIIDDKQIVRAILIYPMEIGRFVPEIIRLIDALQIADKHNAAIPANWMVGNPIINKAPSTFEELEKREEELQQNGNGFNWYLTYKDIEE